MNNLEVFLFKKLIFLLKLNPINMIIINVYNFVISGGIISSKLVKFAS